MPGKMHLKPFLHLNIQVLKWDHLRVGRPVSHLNSRGRATLVVFGSDQKSRDEFPILKGS